MRGGVFLALILRFPVYYVLWGLRIIMTMTMNIMMNDDLYGSLLLWLFKFSSRLKLGFFRRARKNQFYIAITDEKHRERKSETRLFRI